MALTMTDDRRRRRPLNITNDLLLCRDAVTYQDDDDNGDCGVDGTDDRRPAADADDEDDDRWRRPNDGRL